MSGVGDALETPVGFETISKTYVGTHQTIKALNGTNSTPRKGIKAIRSTNNVGFGAKTRDQPRAPARALSLSLSLSLSKTKNS